MGKKQGHRRLIREMQQRHRLVLVGHEIAWFDREAAIDRIKHFVRKCLILQRGTESGMGIRWGRLERKRFAIKPERQPDII